MGLDRPDETREVVGAVELRGDNIGDSDEMDVWGFWISGEEAEPLLGDDEGDGDVGIFEGKELAEVHESVDVTSAGVRQGRQMNPFTDRIHVGVIGRVSKGGNILEGSKMCRRVWKGIEFYKSKTRRFFGYR